MRFNKFSEKESNMNGLFTEDIRDAENHLYLRNKLRLVVSI